MWISEVQLFRKKCKCDYSEPKLFEKQYKSFDNWKGFYPFLPKNLNGLEFCNKISTNIVCTQECKYMENTEKEKNCDKDILE